jgi:hypothetical protein
MRNGFLLSLAIVVLGTGIATAQSAYSAKPAALLPPMAAERDAPESLFPKMPVTTTSAPSDIVPTTYFAGDDGVPATTACADCVGCGKLGSTGYPPGTVWASAEFLGWRIKNGPTPPLVATSPPGTLGILGQDSTMVLVGNAGIKFNELAGARIMLGVWIDEDETVGLEGGYFLLGSRSRDSSVSGSGAPGTPLITRPFFNALFGVEDSELVAFPNAISGTVNVHASTRMQGAELNELVNAWCGSGYRIDLLCGFRFLQLNEGLDIAENVNLLPNVAVLGGTNFSILDQFDATTRFLGGQVGMKSELRRGRFFADFAGKVAAGWVNEIVDIQGSTVISAPGFTPTASPAGLLALPTNSGHHTRTRFAVLPEGKLDFGIQVCDCMRIYVGYDILYLSNAVRPGSQIDRVLNPTQIPLNTLGAGSLIGAPRPAFDFHETDFWAQGIHAGVSFHF